MAGKVMRGADDNLDIIPGPIEHPLDCALDGSQKWLRHYRAIEPHVNSGDRGKMEILKIRESLRLTDRDRKDFQQTVKRRGTHIVIGSNLAIIIEANRDRKSTRL